MRPRVVAFLLSSLALVAFVAPARPADAHAIVRETRPAADEIVAESPSSVTMRFNEAVELAFGALRVFDTNGNRVDRGKARYAGSDSTVRVQLGDDLPDGTYTVTWRVVSADGHPVREAFVFHVGAPGARPEGIARELLAGESGAGRWTGLLAGVGRWALFGGLLVLGGVLAFPVLTGAPRPRRLFPVAWTTTAAATVAGFVVQGAVAGRLPLTEAVSTDALREVADTRYGRVAIARLLLLVLLAVVRRWAPAALVVAVALLATPGLAGHAATTSPTALNVVADVVHVGAAAVWVGGLVALWASRPLVSAVVARFSRIALLAVGAIVATGVLRSWAEVRTFDALDERYGLVLLVKVAAFVPMVALGFLNRRVFLPRLSSSDQGTRWLRRSVTAEAALAVVVLALTAVLVNQLPARIAAGTAGPFTTQVALGPHRLDVLVDPAEVGENAVHLTAFTDRGAPAPIDSMQVLFRLPEADLGPLVAEGKRLAPGHFVVQGRQLSQAGRWVLEVVAVTGRFDEARARVSVLVRR